MREPDSAPRTASGETGVTAETTSKARRIWRLFWAIPRLGLWLSLTPVILASALWASFAIYFSNLPGQPLRTTAAWAFAVGWLAAFLFLRGRLRILIAYGVAFGAVLLWWILIPASNDRDWLANVVRTPTAKVDGNILTVYNVRNFDYRAVDDYDEVWETRQYNLDEIQSLDLILSDWGLRDIVHTMLSFGFANGDYLCLSVETRREKQEPFSIVRGFFKQYELIYVLADERDLLRLRTSFRKEDVYIYPSNTPPEGVRRVIGEVIENINHLAENPTYYHTLTHNCTMGLLPLLDPIRRHREWDIRYFKNGLTAEMAYEHGSFDTALPFEEFKKRAYANQYIEGDTVAQDFSQRARAWQSER
jgi:hypothetical protein